MRRVQRLRLVSAATPGPEIRFNVTVESRGRLLRRLGMTGHRCAAPAPSSRHDVDSNFQRRATHVASSTSPDNVLSMCLNDVLVLLCIRLMRQAGYFAHL